MAKLTIDELKTHLKDEGGFTDEQLTGLNKTQLEYLAGGFMRQSDYDKSMNESKATLAAEQQKLDAANQRLNAEMAEWATIQAQGGDVSEADKKALRDAQAKVDRLAASVKDLATRAGVNPDDILAAANTGGPDLSGFVKASDLDRLVNERVAGITTMSLRLPAILSKIAREHHALTGQHLDESALITEIETRARTKGNQKTLDPVSVWEEMHDVPAKRTAADLAAREQDRKKAFEEGRQAAITESTVPGSHTPAGRHAIVFNSGDRKSALQRPQPGGTTSAALTSLRSGKYRPGAKSA